MVQIEKLFNLYLHFKFDVVEFEILFPDDKDIENLRNDTIPDFFNKINELYWQNFLITIARLLDNHKQGQNINLTLYSLPEILKENGYKDWNKIEDRVNELRHKHRDITIYRRKHLAHFDNDYSTGEKDFNTSTHIDEVKSFLDDMLILIQDTQEALSIQKSSGILMYPGRYKGSRELLRILENGKKRQDSI